jgi:hypothetical protein
MTDRRLKSVERVLAIQAHMRKLAEWRHQATLRDASAARDESRALVAVLNGESMVNGLFTDMTAKRLHRVSLSIWELDAAASVQAGKVIQETGSRKTRRPSRRPAAPDPTPQRRGQDASRHHGVSRGQARGKPRISLTAQGAT